jgi:transcriptional regulator with XRE-family HTH domain
VVALSSLRLARLQRGLSLDEVSFRTNGRLNPGRLSRIERGYVKPSDQESRLLQEILGVSSETVNATAMSGSAQPAHAI